MIYVNLQELANICGYTYATAKTYYYRHVLPPAILDKKSAKWLIDDVMAYSQSLVKQGKAKKTKKSKAKKPKASIKSKRRAENLKWHNDEYVGSKKQALFMLFLFAHLRALNK